MGWYRWSLYCFSVSRYEKRSDEERSGQKKVKQVEYQQHGCLKMCSKILVMASQKTSNVYFLLLRILHVVWELHL